MDPLPYDGYRDTHTEFDPQDYLPRQRSIPSPAPELENDALPRKRQPNLGYAVALLGIGVVVLLLATVVLGVVLSQTTHALPRNAAQAASDMPKTSILLEAVTFAVTFGVAALLFPRLWQRPFLETIRWHAQAAKRNIGKLLLAGVAVSLLAQALESFLTLPKQMPIDEFFHAPSDVWVIAFFGTLVAPVCEEIFFRGFLLRGFAIAYDWITTPKTDEGRRWWQGTEQLTRPAIIVSGVLTSGLFAAMHAAQLGWAWNAVAVLWIVGGVLTYVRVKLNSVAASSIVHATYNGFLFVVMFIATDGFRHLDKLANH